MAKNISSNSTLRYFWYGIVGLATVTALGACQGKGSIFNFKAFSERATETPPPSEQNFEKTFFVDANGKAKTFLCGWAPEVEVGPVGEWFFSHLYQAAPHCNLEFEIREHSLIGKMVNPSFPNDRSRWVEFVEIPIANHFYYERAKDQHGRETNEWIENSGRSHWSARPMIRLNLSGINFRDSSVTWNNTLNKMLQHSTASEIEVDGKAGFLGFTLNLTMTHPWFSSAETQAKLRVNFLRFEHDSKFKKTPYHQENARLMNILHVMGKRHEIDHELYSARWDLSQPVKLYVHGAKEKHIQDLIAQAIEKWNKAFQEEGVLPAGRKAFTYEFHQRQHAFDMRYPGIIWIDDRRISENAPLGIGQAHSDVRNGKILWGSVLLFGGLIESIIQRTYPSESVGQGDESSEMKWPGTAKAFRIPGRLDMPESFLSLPAGSRADWDKNIQARAQKFLQAEMARLQKAQVKNQTAKDIAQQIEGIKQQIDAANQPGIGAAIAADMTQLARQMKQDHTRQFEQKSPLELMGYKEGELPKAPGAHLLGSDRKRLQEIMTSTKNGSERMQRIRSFVPTAVAQFPDLEFNGQALRDASARAEVKNRRSFKEIFDGVVMELTLHEIGHMLGMGHQFKENILPAEGTVPSSIHAHLANEAKIENGQMNMTSVMGYTSGRVWLNVDAKTVEPGPHDRLVLRYLYNQEYSAFDKKADAFKYFKVPEHGRIPEVTDGLPTAYFPQCNDYEASLNADPMCNRWDRGHTAEQLATSYFTDLTDNLVSRLYSFVGGLRADEFESFYGLWFRTFSTMARVRLFYDELRLQLDTDRELSPVWSSIRRSEDALHEFSNACRAESESAITNVHLKKLLFGLGRKSSEIRDLCRAVQVSLREMSFLLTLPEADYTKIDHKERFIMGGYLVGDAQRDFRQMFGKWYQLSNLPLKIAALFNLTNEYSYLYPGWANYYYSMEGRSPLYRSLFAREYTQIVADMVRANMRFESLGESDRPIISNLFLPMAWMLPNQNGWNSDNGALPSEYLRTLRNQTKFDFSIAAVIISANASQVDANTKANHYKRFNGTVYDMMVDKERVAREVYILPKGRVVARVNDMFLVPLTQLKFFSDNAAYVIAIKIDYDYEVGDRLIEESVKYKLTELHEQINARCVNGLSGTGLSHYFSATNDDFEGFFIPPGIATESGKEKTTDFFKSIEREYAKYEAKMAAKMTGQFAGMSMHQVCESSMRGVGQIATAAALLNGYWLPNTTEFFR